MQEEDCFMGTRKETNLRKYMQVLFCLPLGLFHYVKARKNGVLELPVYLFVSVCIGQHKL